ncbi:anti-sigma factor [Arthrobacter sp. Br18]|uniref:anti-sigma factor n=1 Tax=Arthrobacter sp. Br18 TaxID=1312954 RepID=UPI00047C1463|nr:anti-sigma factor [Arthrobacter sp. Br18]
MNRQFAEDLESDLGRGHVVEWAELYALDALGDDERATIDRFLAADPALGATFEERLRTARETIASAYATDEAEPPAGLFDKILLQLPDTQETGSPSRPSRSGQSSRPAGNSIRVPDTSGGATDDLSRRREAKAQRRRGSFPQWLAAGAAAVVVAVGAVTIGQSLQPSLEEEVLQASDLRTDEIVLEPGGRADLAVSREENAAVLTLTGVPAPPEGSVYQMWRLPTDGSAPISVGTMTAEDVAGSKVTAVRDIDRVTGFAITVEPAGGSTTPTLPVVAEIPFQV